MAKVHEGSPGGRSETTGRTGIVKQVGFKPRVKDGGVMNEQSGKSEKEEVIGEGIGESEMEELVPE